MILTTKFNFTKESTKIKDCIYIVYIGIASSYVCINMNMTEDNI